MSLALIVFDCDGVILESVDAKTHAFAQVAEQFGEEARDRLVIYHKLHGGVSRREKFHWLYTDVLGKAAPETEIDRLCDQFASAALENVLNAPFVPGIESVFERWHGRVPLAVCSGTPQKELEFVLEKRNLAHLFSVISGTPPAKAVQLQRIVHDAKLDPADVVMVGDAGTDRDAAIAAETLFYGRGRDFESSGYPWGEDLTGLNDWLEKQKDGE